MATESESPKHCDLCFFLGGELARQSRRSFWEVLSFGVALSTLAVIIFTQGQSARVVREERDKYRDRYHDMLVKHEGWHWSEGLPLPIPPRPKSH